MHAIVPAAGLGSRLGGTPKQYQAILGRPLLQWAVERVCDHPQVAGVTVALAPGDTHFDTLTFAPSLALDRVDGGESRAQSVFNAVRHARRSKGADWVLVHDAARPCLDPASLAELIRAGLAHEHGALLAIPVSDTLKRGVGAPPVISVTVEREGLWAAQTPQLVPAEALEEALAGKLQSGAAPTDEAGAMEAMGWQPLLVPGTPGNIKVTWPSDLALAEAVLRDAEWRR